MTTLPFSWQSAREKQKAHQEAGALSHENFWRREAHRLTWHKPFDAVHDGKFAGGQWFLGGALNVSVNCLDRHIESGLGEQRAIVFENEVGETKTYTYQELHALTCQIASILFKRGIKKGDRVAIYMPLRPEAVASMLACARLGAIHTVIFGGFAKEALIDRIHDAEAKAVITAESTTRKGHSIALKTVVDEALKDPKCASVSTVLCFNAAKNSADPRYVIFTPDKDWPEEIRNPPAFDAQHPLFILYTSGTTGKPKGIFHATGGYLTQVASTMQWVFDLNKDDLYWCTADVGWITGHSYVAYGPLALGQSIFMFEGAVNHPTAARMYQLIDKYKISVLYTAPTAIRMFMAAGEDFKGSHNISSLRLLGSVGEPINPEAWSWYKRVFGENRCDIVDTWWQTETGAMMMTAIPAVHKPKAGSASRPFLGIEAAIINEQGQPCKPNETGYLLIKKPWPSLARGIWGDQERFLQTYFEKIPGVYFTGDGAHVDTEHDVHISGRIDDVVNISGHRLGTAEVESALVAHEAVAEAAVVGIHDDITGQRLVAFVTVMPHATPSPQLEELLKEQVKQCIGSFARPSAIHFSPMLPKTRSGKIMRRLLRSLASGEKITTDISTLEDNNVLKILD